MKKNILLLGVISVTMHAMNSKKIPAMDYALKDLTQLQKSAILDDVEEVERLLKPKEIASSSAREAHSNTDETFSESSRRRRWGFMGRLKKSSSRQSVAVVNTNAEANSDDALQARMNLCDEILKPCCVNGSTQDTIIHHVAGSLAFRVVKKRFTSDANITFDDQNDPRKMLEVGYYYPSNKAKILRLLLQYVNEVAAKRMVTKSGDDGFTPLQLAVIASLVSTKTGYNLMPEEHKEALKVLSEYGGVYSEPADYPTCPTALQFGAAGIIEKYFGQGQKKYPLRIMHALRTNPNASKTPAEYEDYAIDPHVQADVYDFIKKLSRESTRSYTDPKSKRISSGFSTQERAFILSDHQIKKDHAWLDRNQNQHIYQEQGEYARHAFAKRMAVQELIEKQNLQHIKLMDVKVYMHDKRSSGRAPRPVTVTTDEEITCPAWISYVLLREEKQHDKNRAITADQAKELFEVYRQIKGFTIEDIRVTQDGMYMVHVGDTYHENRIETWQKLLFSDYFTYASDAQPFLEQERLKLKEEIARCLKAFKKMHAGMTLSSSSTSIIGIPNAVDNATKDKQVDGNTSSASEYFFTRDIRWDRLFKGPQEEREFWQAVNA